MTIRQPVYASVLVFAACLLSACGSESTSGVYNQVFNVSGHWSGTIHGECFSGGSAPVSMTLSDNGGAISGTITTAGHSSISGGTLDGTAVQAPTNTTGDNPLTGDQENSNSGSVVLSLNSPQATGGVSAVTIDAGGSGYTSTPTVNFSTPPAGGSRATGTAIMGDAGQVTGVVITNPGSGYITAPTVSFSRNFGGSGAIATATIDTATVTNLLTFTLAGTSSKLSGHYSGIWQCCGLAACGSNSHGTICLSRAGLCPPP